MKENDQHSKVPEESFVPVTHPGSGWAFETMTMINKLTPDIHGKAFDPGWFVLRERLEEAERKVNQALVYEDALKKITTGFGWQGKIAGEALLHPTPS